MAGTKNRPAVLTFVVGAIIALAVTVIFLRINKSRWTSVLEERCRQAAESVHDVMDRRISQARVMGGSLDAVLVANSSLEAAQEVAFATARSVTQSERDRPDHHFRTVFALHVFNEDRAAFERTWLNGSCIKEFTESSNHTEQTCADTRLDYYVFLLHTHLRDTELLGWDIQSSPLIRQLIRQSLADNAPSTRLTVTADWPQSLQRHFITPDYPNAGRCAQDPATCPPVIVGVAPIYGSRPVPEREPERIVQVAAMMLLPIFVKPLMADVWANPENRFGHLMLQHWRKGSDVPISLCVAGEGQPSLDFDLQPTYQTEQSVRRLAPTTDLRLSCTPFAHIVHELRGSSIWAFIAVVWLAWLVMVWLAWLLDQQWAAKSRLMLQQLKTNEELKKAVVDLRDAKQSIQDMYQAKSDFTAFLCHELRSPLQTVTGMLDWCNDLVARLDEEHARLLKANSPRVLHSVRQLQQDGASADAASAVSAAPTISASITQAAEAIVDATKVPSATEQATVAGSALPAALAVGSVGATMPVAVAAAAAAAASASVGASEPPEELPRSQPSVSAILRVPGTAQQMATLQVLAAAATAPEPADAHAPPTADSTGTIFGLAEPTLRTGGAADDKARAPVGDEELTLQDGLATISRSCDLMANLIDDVLTMSALEFGQQELKSQAIIVRTLVRDLIRSYSVTAKPGVAVGSTVEDDVPDTIYGDMLRLQQILGNLLSNAIKFTERGRVHLTVRRVSHMPPDEQKSATRGAMSRHQEVSEKAKEAQAAACRLTPGDVICVVFDIRDTGIGILPAQLQSLFEAYSPANLIRYRERGGSGLGLAIVKRLVEIMRGSIHVDSERGVGTTFTVTIPFDRTEQQQQQQQQPMSRDRATPPTPTNQSPRHLSPVSPARAMRAAAAMPSPRSAGRAISTPQVQARENSVSLSISPAATSRDQADARGRASSAPAALGPQSSERVVTESKKRGFFI